VTEVKDQGQCGSCWAFATTGVLESTNLVVRGGTELLSEQELVDCSRGYGNQGCNGGWMNSAFNYIKDNGIASRGSYPYEARDANCRAPSTKAARISGYKDVPGCDALGDAISRQPVAVAVDASNWGSYGQGVFNNCGGAINHGVLAVGVVGGNWKVKNSWGSGWGEAGYIRLSGGNTCAICNYGSYPIL
jgi:C1A family cysteine protease